MVWICVFLSALSHIIELSPFPHEVAAYARNDFSSSVCITIDDVSSHSASNNHSCVQHLSVELPLSASVMLGVPESS